MNDFFNDFNPNDHEPQDDFAVLPDGDYLCLIKKAEMKDARTGNGQYVELEMEVVAGDHKNRRLWDRLNVQNQNQTAQRIARAALADICRAIGQPGGVSEAAELVNHAVCVTVKVANRKDTGEPTNRITKYRGEDQYQAAASTPAKRSPANPFAGHDDIPY